MPYEGQIKHKNLRVRCLRDPHTVREMQMRFIYTKEGTWFPAPCNGCEFLSGAKACYECAATLTSMFFENPDLPLFDPITPKLQSD